MSLLMISKEAIDLFRAVRERLETILPFFKCVTRASGFEIFKKINTKQLNRYMKQKVIKINVDLGLGKFSKTVFGNDLTYEYIQINADYRN